ncbi:hypothetical protein [Streptomyces lavendulae]|uniref:hypothetical protein n=1 Tax=Streptomyces lavendulae TaxID=1914 RepID=UPI0037F95301
MTAPIPVSGPLRLDYTLSTVPARLRVSTATQDKLGRLDVTVTGGTTSSPLFCEQITITLPIGPGPTQLTEAAPDVIAPEVTGGTSPIQGGTWDPAESSPSGTLRTFTFTPRRDEARFDGTWTLKLSLTDIPLNRQPGDAPITITESTRTTDGNYGPREETMPITKSPPEFVFTDFRPENIAVTRTQNVKLFWVCEGDADATFTLFWTGNTNGESIAKNIRTWPPAGRNVTITKDTSFMLRAKTKNLSGTDEYHYQTIVINCTNPDLTANTLNVTNGTNLNTLAVTNGTNLNTLTNTGRISALAGIQGDGSNPLRVHQPAGLKVDAALDVGEYGGHATFRGQVTVAGTTNLNGTTNTQNLTVNSSSTLKASKLESSGWAYGIHVNSPLQISGFLNGYNNTRIAINSGLNVSGGIAGARVIVTRQSWTASWKETSGRKQAPDNQVMVGRGHTGDENGQTEHLYATIRVE